MHTHQSSFPSLKVRADNAIVGLNLHFLMPSQIAKYSLNE